MHRDVYELIWFKCGEKTEITAICISIQVQVTLTLIQGHRAGIKQSNVATVISQRSQLIWMEYGILLRLVGLMNFTPILPCLISIQDREPYIANFTRKKRALSLASIFTFIDFFPFKLGMMINTTALQLLYWLESPWTSFKVTFVWE